MLPTTSHSTGSRSSSRTTSPWNGSTDMSEVATSEASAAAIPEGPIAAFTVTLITRRFDPEVDAEPHWQDFDVQMYATDRVLDALHQIKWEQDGSLTFRRSCAHGICGPGGTRS